MKTLVKGEGPVPCSAMIIGEAPGAHEEELGRPFVGRSGQLLEEALAVAGVSRSKIYITNVYKLRLPGNRDPNDQEIGDHASYLHSEIGSVKPKAVLTVGRIPTEQFVYVKKTISEMRGSVYRTGGMRIFPTFHPAFVLRHPKKAKEPFFEDVERFIKEAFGSRNTSS